MRRVRRRRVYEPRAKINFQIRAREVRVIGSKGEQLGVRDTREAIKLAQEEGVDLVEVAANENPPVCKIVDFGKHLYDEKKKKQESKKKQTKVEIKECKFRPKIGEHDFDVRIRRAVRFLSQGNKVKFTVMFRGREHAHPELAERLLERAYEAIKDLGRLEIPPKKEGRDMHCLISPLPMENRKKALKARGIDLDAEREKKRLDRERTKISKPEPDEIEEIFEDDEEVEDEDKEDEDEDDDEDEDEEDEDEDREGYDDIEDEVTADKKK